MSTDDRIAAFLDKEDIREIIYTYSRGLDRVDGDLLRTIFHPGATLSYGLYEGDAHGWIDHAMRLLARTGPTQHHVTNILINLDGDRASSESYAIALHMQAKHFEDQPAVDLVIYVRYLDRFERRDGRWGLLHRKVVYDWNQSNVSTARWDGPFFENYRPRGVRGPEDISYELLELAGEVTT